MTLQTPELPLESQRPLGEAQPTDERTDQPRRAWSAQPYVVIVIPGPAVSKKRHRSRIATTKSGKQFVHEYPDGETAKYETIIRYRAEQEMKGKAILLDAVRLRVIERRQIAPSWSKKKQEAARAGWLRPITKPDWDNVGKITDALNKIVWHDDGQVVDALVQKYYADRPQLEIYIWELSSTLL